jgi:hypothetical protein
MRLIRAENRRSSPRARQTEKPPGGARDPRGVTKWGPTLPPTTGAPDARFVRVGVEAGGGLFFRAAESVFEANGPSRSFAFMNGAV